MALISSQACLLLPYLWKHPKSSALKPIFFHRLSVGPSGYQPEHWKSEVGLTKLNLSPDLLCKCPLTLAWPPAHPKMARQEPAQHWFAFGCCKCCWNMPGHWVHHPGKHQVRWRWKEEGAGKCTDHRVGRKGNRTLALKVFYTHLFSFHLCLLTS